MQSALLFTYNSSKKRKIHAFMEGISIMGKQPCLGFELVLPDLFFMTISITLAMFLSEHLFSNRHSYMSSHLYLHYGSSLS